MRTTFFDHTGRVSGRTMCSAIMTGIVAGVMAAGTSSRAAGSPPTLVVPAADVTLHVATPLPDGVRLRSADGWQLVEIGQPEVKIPAQFVPAMAADGSVARRGARRRGRLVANLPPRADVHGPRRFRLEPAQAAGDTAAGFRFEDVDEKSLKILDGDAPVLVYNHGTITAEHVPQSDHRRSRGCYVHPLWGLNGEILTDDFPKDHYHHHGVFWTWPHVRIEGREYDIWAGPNIKDKFVRWICRRSGPVAAVLAVENGWFVGDRKVMIERVWLRVHKVSGEERSLDVEFTWIPVDKPITLQGAGGKSYGGLTVRFAPRSREDTLITVPSGPTEGDLPEAPLAWADFTSRFSDAASRSGAAVFVDPGHPDFPPTWLTRYYGPLCVGWPGVKPKTFPPGKPIRLNYRRWIHKSKVGLEELANAYEAYAAALKVKWE